MRIAFSGKFKFDIMAMVSMRASASRGLLAWIVVMRTVVAGIHGLEHVERFFAANFADDDSVGPHTQAVDDQLTGLNRSFAVGIRRAALQSNYVTLLQLQFG